MKVSQLAADEQAAGRFQRYHAVVEKRILKSGIPYTFLRPNLFMQGLLNFRSTIASEGAFYAPAGDAKVSIVDVRDIASIAARALTEWGHAGKTYDITGPGALTHAEMAQQLSKAVGKQITYVDLPPGAMREARLRFGMPAWQADGLVEDYDHYRLGEASAVTSTVRDLTGKEATSFLNSQKTTRTPSSGGPVVGPDRLSATFRTPARETSPEPPAAARLPPLAQNLRYPRKCCASWCPDPWSSRPIPSSPSLPR